MHLNQVRSAACGVAFAVVGTLAVSGTAQAAVYNGTWDPAYGGMFPNLGWKATAVFDVPTSCLDQVDDSYGAEGACAGFSVLSAELSFYNVATPGTVLESFSLNTSKLVVNGIDIVGGQFVGINTGFFSPVVPTGASASIAGDGVYGFNLIFYDHTLAQLVYTAPKSSPLCFSGNPALCGYSANAAVGTITPAVPEPQAYALMLAGLGALGWAARRRARRSA